MREILDPSPLSEIVDSVFIQALFVCPTCGGSGTQPNVYSLPCIDCDGEGGSSVLITLNDLIDVARSNT